MNFAVKPTFTGSSAVLRPFTEADADVMWEIMQDPDVVRFTFEPSVRITRESLRAWYGSRAEQPDRLDLAVTDRTTGELVGEVVLNEWDPDARSCNFRTLIGPRGRGRGLGTEAIRLIVEYGFERLGLRRIELAAYGTNTRALHVYEKVGFVVEGVRREVRLRDGEWADEVIMAMLDREWAALSSTAR
ncbi:GNAT family protein [Streptomyces sp. NPDC047860]|uniref:GNAT family N-acetyltransferase n=1 Tax=Streptomyces sp. NPDC047860 TaxID=3155743 RepID=UPI0033C0A485